MFHAGLGPVYEMKTTSQKLFAAIYALFAAVIFLAAVIYFITKILILEHL
jgi:phage shock protein PspC (stress-responsive transcriptional regulator)